MLYFIFSYLFFLQVSQNSVIKPPGPGTFLNGSYKNIFYISVLIGLFRFSFSQTILSTLYFGRKSSISSRFSNLPQSWGAILKFFLTSVSPFSFQTLWVFLVSLFFFLTCPSRGLFTFTQLCCVYFVEVLRVGFSC